MVFCYWLFVGLPLYKKVGMWKKEKEEKEYLCSTKNWMKRIFVCIGEFLVNFSIFGGFGLFRIFFYAK